MAHTASNHAGEQRRRSSRIAQAVPLTVRGVDLLGQPFEERTATLVVNYHGCKYASKHHLPKNTWLTLELPPRDAQTERQCVRARVAWIQRPRTVRELFQIGVELETADNIWGIAFPPEDWQASPGGENPARQEEGFAVSAMPDSRKEKIGGNMTASGQEVPPALANYMERLMTHASLTSSAPPGASSAASAVETSPLLRELHAQLQRQAEKTLEAAASRADKMIHRAAEKLERETRATAEAFYERWREEFERERTSASEQLSAQLASSFSEAQQELRASLTKEFEADLGQAKDALSKAEERAEALREGIEAAAAEARSRFEQFRKEMDSAGAALKQRLERPNEEFAEAGERAGIAWRERLESEMLVAREQWNELLQSSLDSAVQRLVSRLAECSQSAVASTEQKMAARLVELGQPITQTAAAARQSLAEVQASLDQEVARAKASLADIEQAANRVSEYSAQLEAASQDTVNELHRRLETILASQTAELNRRAEGLVAGLADRLGPGLESAGQQFVARAVGEAESRLAPHIERAQESLRQLAAREVQAEETLRLHRERLRQASERLLRENATQMAAAQDQHQSEFEEVRRAALAKWNEEIEASGVRVTHTTFEALVKASDWYQQQAKASVQSLLDDAFQKADQEMDEKVGEASRRFAAQLDEQRHAHVEEARGRLERAADGVLGKASGQLDQAAEATAAKFGEVLHRISEQSLEGFAESSRGTLGERSAQLQAAADEARRNLEADAGHSLLRFETRLSEHVKRAVAEAQESLAAQLAASTDSLRDQLSAFRREWEGNLERLNGESIERYQGRLQAACDSWMTASLRKLNEHGQNAIDLLSRAAEQALRNSCSDVFDALAVTMRERLLGNSGLSQAANPAPPASEAAAPAEKHHRKH